MTMRTFCRGCPPHHVSGTLTTRGQDRDWEADSAIMAAIAVVVEEIVLETGRTVLSGGGGTRMLGRPERTRLTTGGGNASSSPVRRLAETAAALAIAGGEGLATVSVAEGLTGKGRLAMMGLRGQTRWTLGAASRREGPGLAIGTVTAAGTAKSAGASATTALHVAALAGVVLKIALVGVSMIWAQLARTSLINGSGVMLHLDQSEAVIVALLPQIPRTGGLAVVAQLTPRSAQVAGNGPSSTSNLVLRPLMLLQLVQLLKARAATPLERHVRVRRCSRSRAAIL